MLTDDRSRARKLRQARVRRKLRGDATRPRLCVFRSKRHIYVQVISDATGETLLSASTMVRELRERVPKTSDVGAAKAVGEEIAKRCLAKGISVAVFDRNGFLYHGRVRAVAEGAREAGLRI